MRIAFLCGLTLCAAAMAADTNWQQFGGPTFDGHAPAASAPPTAWSETDHVKWKTAIPGEGFSSPVIWGDQIWCTTALSGGRSLHAICADLNSGKIVFDVEVFSVPTPEQKHSFNSYASPTPVVEDGRVYVGFGSNGFACLDTKTGKPLWTNRDFKLKYATGGGSSPVLYKDFIIIDCDAMDGQFLLALDKNTGKVAWKANRSMPYNDRFPLKKRSFNTPIIVKIGGNDRVLDIGGQRAYCYDPATGREIWNIDHGGYSTVARPVFVNGLMVISTGYDAASLMAVKVPAEPAADAKPVHLGDDDVKWKSRQGAPYKPTPIAVDGKIYVASDGGVVRCLEAATGESIWSKRLGQAYSASPLSIGGNLFFFSEKGEVHVLKPAGAQTEVVKEFTMEEGFMATPAVIGNALILRTTGHLYRVE